jgi:hypothetical protein
LDVCLQFAGGPVAALLALSALDGESHEHNEGTNIGMAKKAAMATMLRIWGIMLAADGQFKVDLNGSRIVAIE